jgi:hypothetical protein
VYPPAAFPLLSALTCSASRWSNAFNAASAATSGGTSDLGASSGNMGYGGESEVPSAEDRRDSGVPFLELSVIGC